MNLRNDPLCASGKRGWATEAEAQRQLRGAQRNRSEDPDHGRKPGCVERDVKHCKACGWYHLTSSTGPGRRSTYANRGRRS
jgi:hypothetical protein